MSEIVDLAEAERRQREERARQRRDGSRPDRFSLRRWGEARDPVQCDRLVHKLLGLESFAVLCGPPGCGKSFLALDVALSIARGVPVFDRSVTVGSVLYVNGEGFGGFPNRMIAYGQHRGVPNDEEIAFAWIATAPDLGPGGADVEHVIGAAAELQMLTGRQVVLVVIDTLARSMGAGDENAGPDMAAFIAACDRIRRETGATVLVVHHVGKVAERGMRGHSSLLAAADTVVSVERAGEGSARTATAVKQKDGADGVALAFELRPVEIGRDDLGEPITSCVVVPGAEPPQESSASKARRGLSAAQRRALEALEDALARQGAVPPSSDHIPRGVPTVPESAWREIAYSRTLGSDSPAARQKAFRRAAEALMSGGHVGKWKENVWVIQ